MAQHQAQATYQVNVLVRLVRSWFSSVRDVVLIEFNIGEASSASSSPSTKWIADHAQVKNTILLSKWYPESSNLWRSYHIPPPTRHFSSNDSNPSLVDLDEGRRSPSLRPRSRSLRYLFLLNLLVASLLKSCLSTSVYFPTLLSIMRPNQPNAP